MQKIIVDITPGFRMPTIFFSQGDVGTQFAIDLRSRFGDSLPASPTVTIQATKPSGFGFSVTATSVTNGVAVFTTTAEMTDEAGRFLAELKVSKDSVTLFTANFNMNGEPTTHPEGTIDGSAEVVIPELTQLVERVEDAASSVLDMTVEAETLAAGSQATYSYDEDTNTATFGIPQGEAGAGATDVTASAYSSSKTYAVGDYVIHNSNLYRCTTAITTAESFTAAHWTQVVLADDVCDLKSDLNYIDFAKTNFANAPNLINFSRIKYGGFINGNTGAITAGSSGSGLNCYTEFISVEEEATYYVAPSCVCNIVFYDSAKEYISGGMVDYSTGLVETPTDTAFIRMSFKSSEISNNLSLCKVRALNKYISVLDNAIIKDMQIDVGQMVLGSRTDVEPYKIISTSQRCTTGLVWVKNKRIIKTGTNKLALYIYTSDLVFEQVYTFDYFTSHEYADIEAGRYICFVFAFSDDSTISTTDFATFANSVTFANLIDERLSDLNLIFSGAEWRNGSIGNTSNANAIAFKNIMPNNGATSITIHVDEPLPTGYKYRYQLSTFSLNSGETSANLANRVTYDWTVVSKENKCTFAITDGSKGFAFALYMLDGSDNYVPLRILTFDTNAIKIMRNFTDVGINSHDYLIQSDLTKKPVSLMNLGKLTYLQAFCIYNNKYYSIDGNNISVQNGALVETDSSTLYTGHGNNLQLGNSKYAYASGWNDNKIYKVDLDSLEVDSVISLPTTGYTTGVVDEVRNYAYIFQRDSNPNYEDYYNFIVYDITNNSVISTRKILSFGAMQSADFFNDRIIVLNGLGNSTCPNGYRVFDTSGNIMADYFLNTLSTDEPEGVCLDRATHELYISTVNKDLYRIRA